MILVLLKCVLDSFTCVFSLCLNYIKDVASADPSSCSVLLSRPFLLSSALCVGFVRTVIDINALPASLTILTTVNLTPNITLKPGLNPQADSGVRRFKLYLPESHSRWLPWALFGDCADAILFSKSGTLSVELNLTKERNHKHKFLL